MTAGSNPGFCSVFAPNGTPLGKKSVSFLTLASRWDRSTREHPGFAIRPPPVAELPLALAVGPGLRCGIDFIAMANMVRVEQCKNEKAAKAYYTKGDYYATDRQELPGWWGGEAAERLGLRGLVEKRAFDRLCDNLHPDTGEKLTARMRADRTPGYDISFSACKSVSILYGLTGNADLLAAFRWAYRKTMKAMEAEMKARVRKGGQMTERVVGNLAWAEYVHLTSRPVKGMIDPQLHVHCFAFNTVFDPVEGCWKAGAFHDLKKHAPRFQAMFQRKRPADCVWKASRLVGMMVAGTALHGPEVPESHGARGNLGPSVISGSRADGCGSGSEFDAPWFGRSSAVVLPRSGSILQASSA